MDDLREKRYRDRIRYIIENVQDLTTQPHSDLEKKGIFYSLQTSIEALTDLIAMLIKDLGIQVQEDNKNIQSLIKVKHLEPILGE